MDGVEKGIATDESEPSTSHIAQMEDTDGDAIEDITEGTSLQNSVLEMEPVAVNGKQIEPLAIKKNKETSFSLKKCFLLNLVGMVVAITFMVVVGVTMSRVKSLPMKESSSDSGKFSRAAVATDVGLCSELGRDILKQGGSAVDAAVSSLLCVGVVNPQSSGLGGGMFMLVYDKSTGNAEALMAREKAPKAATADMYNDNPTEQTNGYRSVAVPGELRGMWEAHQKYGKLPWEDLFKPVIRLAEEGFPATAHLARALQLKMSTIQNITSLPQYAGMVARYRNPDGSWKNAGDIVYAPKLAKTLQAIARNGVNELSTGMSGQQIIYEMLDYGGIITTADLEEYTSDWMQSSTFSLGQGKSLRTTPLPSGGPFVQFILNILKNYNLTSDKFKTTDDKKKVYHKFVEASKFAFALRSYVGDVDTPEVQKILNKLQSDMFAQTLFSKIQDDHVTYTNASDYNPLKSTTSHYGGTCHLSVVDEEGNAVSVTSSVNYYFGSGIMSNTTGIILNNEMADFDTPVTQPASSVNYIAPGKMPLSAMSPIIVLNENTGDVELVAGSAGSRAIITGNAWVALRSVFTDSTLQEIIDEKRVHNQLQPNNIVTYETGLQEDIINGLINMGHLVQEKSLISVVQAIRKSGSGWDAYSDPRKHGQAAGY